MVRTQISMEREMLRRARIRATERGISLAQYIRELVERDLGGDTSLGDVRAIFDILDTGRSDVARHKDRMIAEAIAAGREPR